MLPTTASKGRASSSAYRRRIIKLSANYVSQALLLAVATLAYCAVFLTNAYLQEEAPNSHVVEQCVEWQVQNLLLPAFVEVSVVQLSR